jgi:hypothetical protein
LVIVGYDVFLLHTKAGEPFRSHAQDHYCKPRPGRGREGMIAAIRHSSDQARCRPPETANGADWGVMLRTFACSMLETGITEPFKVTAQDHFFFFLERKTCELIPSNRIQTGQSRFNHPLTQSSLPNSTIHKTISPLRWCYQNSTQHMCYSGGLRANRHADVPTAQETRPAHNPGPPLAIARGGSHLKAFLHSQHYESESSSA